MRQSSFRFRAGALLLWFFAILLARKQRSVTLQRSARAGLPSAVGLHLILISPVVATWPQAVGEHEEGNDRVVQALGLDSEVLSLNPDCVA